MCLLYIGCETMPYDTRLIGGFTVSSRLSVESVWFSQFQETNHLQVFLCLLLVFERLLAGGAEVLLDSQVLKSVHFTTGVALALEVAKAAFVSGVAGIRHRKLKKRYMVYTLHYQK